MLPFRSRSIPVPSGSDSARIVLAGVFAFPNGQGASGRMCAYARGLVALGADVRVLCLRPTSRPDGPELNPASGTYAGVPFEYTCGTTIARGPRILRAAGELRGCVRAWRAIHEAARHAGPTVVLSYGTESAARALLLWAAARTAKALFVGEMTEEPYVRARPGLVTTVKRLIHDRLTCKLFDGFVVISRHLEHRFGPLLRRDAPLVRVPVLVDTAAFTRTGRPLSHPPRALYCGNLLSEAETGALFRVWADVVSEVPEAELVVVGDDSDPEVRKRLSEMVERLGLRRSVRFTGLLPREAMPAAVWTASVAVLPRPPGLFSAAGLPNKLGEYLASGVPVVTTAVGDIAEYIRDREEGYLVPPGDEAAFARAVTFVLKHPEQAASVGAAGQAASQRTFGLHANCVRLTEMFATAARRRSFSGW